MANVETFSPFDEFSTWCFISYSHVDARLASKVQRTLENYRLPRKLSQAIQCPPGLQARIRPVFVDRTHLAGVPRLWDALKATLDKTATLIILCSPTAAKSNWVAQEIDYFRSIGRETAIYVLVALGHPNASDPELECLPVSIRRRDQGNEPFLIDLRGGRSTFRTGMLRLIAGLYHLSLDELVRRHAQQTRRRIVAAAMAGTFMAAVGIVLALRGFAGDFFHERIAAAQALASHREFRAAELKLKEAPPWYQRLAPGVYHKTREDLLLSLGFRAGIVEMPPFEFNYPEEREPLLLSDDEHVAVMSEETLGASAGQHGKWLSVFDRMSGRLIERDDNPNGRWPYALDRTGTVAAFARDGGVDIRRLKTGEVVSRPDIGGDRSPTVMPVPSLNRYLVLSASSSRVLLVDASTGAEIGRLEAANHAQFKRIILSPRGRQPHHASVLFEDGEIQDLDLSTGTHQSPHLVSTANITDLYWSSSVDNTVLAGDEDGNLISFQADTGQSRLVAKYPKTVPVRAAALLANGHLAFIRTDRPKRLYFVNPVGLKTVNYYIMPQELFGSSLSALTTFDDGKGVLLSMDASTAYVPEEHDPDTIIESDASTHVLDNAIGLYSVDRGDGSYEVGEASARRSYPPGQLTAPMVSKTSLAKDGRWIEFIGTTGKRVRTEMSAPRLLRRWFVSDAVTMQPVSRFVFGCPLLALSPTGYKLAARTTTGFSVFSRKGEKMATFQDPDANDISPAAYDSLTFDPTGQWIVGGNIGAHLAIVQADTGRVTDVRPDTPTWMIEMSTSDGCGTPTSPLVTWTEPDQFEIQGINGLETWRVSAGTGDAGPTLSRIGIKPNNLTAPKRSAGRVAVPADHNDVTVTKEPMSPPKLRRSSDQGLIATLDMFSWLPSAIIFSPDGQRLVVAATVSNRGDDGQSLGGYAIVDPKDGHVIRLQHRYIEDTRRVGFSPDSRILLIENELIDAATGHVIVDLTADAPRNRFLKQPDDIIDHVFSASDDALLVIRRSGVIEEWSLAP